MQYHQASADVAHSVVTAVTPFLPLLGIFIGALLAGGFAVWNRRRGAVETRAPDVNEIWTRQAEDQKMLDAERRLRRRLEDFAREVLRAFLSYVHRVQAGGSVELTTYEQKILNAEVPTSANDKI